MIYKSLLHCLFLSALVGLASGCSSDEGTGDDPTDAADASDATDPSDASDSPEPSEPSDTDLGYADLTSVYNNCLLYTSPSPRDATLSRMPSSA